MNEHVTKLPSAKRRKLIAGVAAGVGLMAAPPLIRAQSNSKKPFEGKTLRLFIYSGAWEKAINTSFIPRFEEMTGAKVVPDPGWWDSIPKLKASPPGQPAFDLVLTDATQGYPSIKEGLFQTFDKKAVPNLAKIAPSAVNNWIVQQNYGVTFPDSVQCLAWNKEMINFQPTGWADLMRDDVRGKVAMYNSFYMSLHTMAAIKVASEGKPGTANKEMMDNLAGVMKFARENRDRVKYWWPTSTDMNLNLTQKNVAIGNMHSNGLLPLMRQKPEINAIIPDADRVAVQLMWVIPTGTKEKELAQVAMNYLIGEEFQEALGKNGNNTAILSVAQKNAAADPLWGRYYFSTADKIANIQYYPYDAYFKDWDNIVNMWDREILRKKA